MTCLVKDYEVERPVISNLFKSLFLREIESFYK